MVMTGGAQDEEKGPLARALYLAGDDKPPKTSPTGERL